MTDRSEWYLEVLQPADVGDFMAMATAMHEESRFNEWSLDDRELVHIFGQYLESSRHRGWMLKNADGHNTGLLCVRVGKRRGVRVWEIWDELFYIEPEYRGDNGMSVMLDGLKKYRMEIEAMTEMPTVLYLCPVASQYSQQIAGHLERLGGKTVGYMVRMED